MSTAPAFVELGLGLLFVFTLRITLVAGLATAWTRLSSWARRRRVYRVELAPGQLASELRATGLVVLFDAVVAAAVLSSGQLHFHDQPSAWRVVGTFAALFVWYEVWFYFTHRLLHTRALYFLHRQHHVARVTDPFASMSFGLVERGVLTLGLLGFATVLSWWVPLARGGLVLYVFSNYVLNVLGHTNIEALPAHFPRTLPGRFFISSTFHAMHHARLQGHYGLFTQVLDRLGGTYFEDFPQVHARAASGEGLRTLGERVSDDEGAPVSAWKGAEEARRVG
jgi:Delta7-sterol 5-desaturase